MDTERKWVVGKSYRRRDGGESVYCGTTRSGEHKFRPVVPVARGPVACGLPILYHGGDGHVHCFDSDHVFLARYDVVSDESGSVDVRAWQWEKTGGGYRLRLDTCATCRYRYERNTHDSGRTLYCALGAPPRPPDPDAWDEYPHDDEHPTIDERKKISDDWDRWSAGREVREYGACDRHELARKDAP